MFYSVWEFVINLLETVLFDTVANGKYQKRRFNYHHIKQLVYIFSKSVFITILNLMNGFRQWVVHLILNDSIHKNCWATASHRPQ